ncbi:hypothetical protein [Microvirga soli]|uniref:hypothetical protein n=1 Tax=Microvirga soli TaxID=1854496 RepID=UPI00191EF367|nr:hypothetical protein [Microvirga soli]
MVPQTFYALVLAARALLPGDTHSGGDALRPEPQAPVARYEPESREVTNWRSEAMDALEPKPVVAMAAVFRAERPFVTRCVKLNNYWCIKSARWNGELATDAEGHVGFATADHSADAAANLLRRYYLEYNRKSALDIVRRWAPAECNVATGIGGMAMLAVRGIGGTVRAQYLASRRKKGGAVRYTAKAGPGGKPGRVSLVIPMTSKTPQYRVPSIAAGMGEKPKPTKPEPLVATRRKPVREPATATAAPKPGPKVQVAAACPSEEQRHRNYAGRMVDGLGLGPADDLKLFAEDGTPQPNLAHVMLAMSAFELGALRASPEMVEDALRRMIDRIAVARNAEASRLP